MELLNAKLEMWMGGVVVETDSLFKFFKCQPMTCEESHTGPSIITFFLFAANNATGHVPNTLLSFHISIRTYINTRPYKYDQKDYYITTCNKKTERKKK